MSKIAKPPWVAQLSPKARALLARFEAEVGPAAEPPPPAELPRPAPARAPSVRGHRRGERRRPAGKRAPPRRVQRRAEQARRADDAYLKRLRQRLRERGCELPEWMGIRGIPRRVWVMCRDVLSDPSGRAARIWFRRLPDKAFLGALRLAALVPVGEDGQYRYGWTDERARRVTALGLALYQLAIPTLRRGAWNGLVRGVPRGALLALLACPYSGARPSLSALAGRHRADASLDNGQLGYLRALEAAGVLYSQQLPASDAEPFECIGPSGYTTNRYWVLSGELSSVVDDEQRAALMALAGEGWRLVTERPVRAARGRVAAPPAPAELLAQPP